MIRNIVFDMGMVLMTFDPMLPCMRHAKDAALAEKLCQAIFRHPEWGQYVDGGLTDDPGYMQVLEKRLPDPAERAVAEAILADWTLDGLYPKPEMQPFVQSLLEQGYHLYLLSNVGFSFHQFQYKMPFLSQFDGIVLSCEEHLVKPHKAIYDRLCEKFGLKADECLFVDDMLCNVEGAQVAGLHGHCFADGDIERLKNVISELK